MQNDEDDTASNKSEELKSEEQEANLSKSFPVRTSGPPKLNNNEWLAVTFKGTNPSLRNSDSQDIGIERTGYGVQKLVRCLILQNFYKTQYFY